MNKWKALSILFFVLTLGAVSEAMRIFNSTDEDIANDRTFLSIMAIVITGIFVFLAVMFWRKSAKK